MGNNKNNDDASSAPRLRKSKPRFKEKVESFLTGLSEKNSLLDKLYYSSEESFDDATGYDDGTKQFFMKDNDGEHIPIKMEGLKELWKQSGKPDIGSGAFENRAFYMPAAKRNLLFKLFGRDYINAGDHFGVGADKNDIISELAHGLRYQDPKEHGYKSRRDMLRESDKLREQVPLGGQADRDLYHTEGNEEHSTHSVTEPIMRDWLKDNFSYSEKSEKEIRDLKARNLRGGKEFINEDGSPSTVRMRNEKIEDEWVAFPTLFHNEKDGWLDLGKDEQVWDAYEYAKNEDEVFYFGDDSTAASNFAHGDWKPTMEEKFINSIKD